VQVLTFILYAASM